MSQCLYYIKQDLYRYARDKGFRAFLVQYFRHGEGFRYTVWLRICHFSKKNKIGKILVYPVASMILKHYKYKYGYDFSTDTEIGPGLLIYHISGIVFKPQKAGKNLTISQCVTVGMTIHNGVKEYPILGNNVYIAPGSKIIGNITVGDNVAVGANTLLNKSVEDNAVVVGNPGKVISYNGSTEYVNNPIE